MNKHIISIFLGISLTFMITLIVGCATPTIEKSDTTTITGFDLGDTTITFPNGSTTLLRQRGQLIYPNTNTGSLPIILFFGARTHNECKNSSYIYPCQSEKDEIRYESAYNDILTKIAAQGYLIVNLDMNSIHIIKQGQNPLDIVDNSDGLTRLTATVTTILNNINTINIPYTIDINNITLIGHSHGGELAIQLPPTLSEKYRNVIQNIIAIAPSIDNIGGIQKIENKAQAISDAPITITMGTCDQDTEQTAITVIKDMLTQNRTTPIQRYMISNMTHFGIMKHPDISQKESCNDSQSQPASSKQQSQLITDLIQKTLQSQDIKDSGTTKLLRKQSPGQSTILFDASTMMDIENPTVLSGNGQICPGSCEKITDKNITITTSLTPMIDFYFSSGAVSIPLISSTPITGNQITLQVLGEQFEGFSFTLHGQNNNTKKLYIKQQYPFYRQSWKEDDGYVFTTQTPQMITLTIDEEKTFNTSDRDTITIVPPKEKERGIASISAQ